jgi:COMPASS component SWD3
LFVTSLETGLALTADRLNNPFLGAIISLDLNPVHPNLLVIGTMDENHALLEIQEIAGKVYIVTHQKWHCHSKYVIRVKWHPNGTIFATASHDQSIIFWELDETKTNATQLKKLNFSGIVEAIEFTKDGKCLVAAIRENAFLQYIHLENWDISLANVNELGDDYVSFTVLELKLSPDGSQLLASTDMSRAILFRQGTEIQMQNLYGFETDGYGQPRTIFDNHGLIYMTSQDFRVYIYEAKSGAHIHTLPPHTAIVRDLDYHPDKDLLASASYDKTINIWKRSSL